MIAISIRGLGRYFGPPVSLDGGGQPREAWRTLLRIAGIHVKLPPDGDTSEAQRAVTTPGHVLRDISMDIEQGSVTCLTGPSGCGKSVLLKILGGVIAPTSGRVEIYGEMAKLLNTGDNVDARMTAQENIQQSPSYRAAPSAAAAEQFEAEVIAFAELQGFEHVPLRTFSTGMTMRLNVALTLCSTAPILLIDDVFAVGDISFQHKIVEKVAALREQRRTLLVAASDDAIIDQIATRVLTLGNGHIVSDAPPTRIGFGRPSSAQAECEWYAAQDLPENDVMALRSLQTDRVRRGDGDYLELGLTFEAKVAHLRCRPSVTVRRQKKVLFRSLYPDHIEITAPGRFACAARIPLDILGNETYLLTIDMHAYRGKDLYLLKARDAVTLEVRRETAPGAERRQPMLTVAWPWELESMAEAQV